MGDAVLELACELINRPSVTPDDQGCLEIIADRLEAIGFEVEPMPFGQVSNLWARRGHNSPLLCFAGHTDVVPPGPRDQWRNDPFAAEVHEGKLFGRGAADMKGALAAMVCACERFFADHPETIGSLAFLLTSDEEGLAVDGTRKVVENLQARGLAIDYCVVGEPSSARQLGDTLRVGRRGSLNGHLKILGTQGHVAYPEEAHNPIHDAARAIAALTSAHWDNGNRDFPSTTFQFSNIQGGTGASNVIPGDVGLDFNFRFSPESTAESLQQRCTLILDALALDYQISWELSGQPFYTADSPLLEAARKAISEVCEISAETSTGGGTSDGRFIAPTGAAVVELGLLNQSIHQINENTPVADLLELSKIYERIMELLLL
ncbi:MAG: succinyl-diaminopimelate desuccinylase [Chromatiales bacterium]|nr:succinyl-diaminopimelate desuccinylase [Chromatiales bacterium]